jgi:hypothetical protein
MIGATIIPALPQAGKNYGTNVELPIIDSTFVQKNLSVRTIWEDEMETGSALARSQGGLRPPSPPDTGLGWLRYKRVNCEFYLGSFICAICIREGFDMRDLFCPLGRRGDSA